MLGQPRTAQRRARKVASDEGALRGDIVRLASRFGRYGYRRVTDMLRIEGWGVKHKRVERIWRQEGLKVPERQPKRGRLWLNDGSCIRLRPLYRGHVWSYDFVASRTHDVLEVLADLFVRHGPPEYLRSDNGPEVHREARAAVVGARGHRDALSASGIDGGPLFRSLRKDGTVGGRLPAGQVPRIYKAMAGRAGFSAQMVRRISGHSPRVGAAQDMIASGIGTPAIMQAGRWKSAAMVQRYGERLLAKRNGAAQLARLQKRR